jgi:hypothetical protein
LLFSFHFVLLSTYSYDNSSLATSEYPSTNVTTQFGLVFHFFSLSHSSYYFINFFYQTGTY